MTLTLVDKQLSTLLPNGTVLKTWIESGGSWAHSEHRIGEKKRINLSYTSDTDLTGFNIFISPQLFPFEGTAGSTGKPPVHFAFQYNPTSGIEYTAPFASISTIFLGSLVSAKNFTVTVIPDGTTSFEIAIDFYMIHDQLGNIPFQVDNHPKLLKDWYGNPEEILPNNSNINNFPTINTVYKTPQISPRVYMYFESTLQAFPGIQLSKEEKFIGFGAGWYNQNKYGTIRWFTNTYFDVKRGGTSFSDLSATLPSDVIINANTDSALNPVTHFLVKIIRTDKFDNYVDMDQNYESDFQLIEAANSGGTKIIGPMTDPDEITPQQWQATFKVPPLVYNAKYRFIGIAYSFVDGQPFRVNSFISGEYVCNALPSYTGQGFNVRASLDDYNRQFEGHDLECAIEERMRAKVKLYFPFNKWKNDIFNRLGLVTSNDIRRYLIQVFAEISEEYYDTTLGLGTIKNIYDLKDLTNDGTGNFNPTADFTADFGSAHAEFTYSWRNRFEANDFSVLSTINGAFAPPQAAQYWGGKTLKVKFTFLFHYDDYFVPFTDEIIVEQQIRVKDYGELAVRSYDAEENEFGNLTNICNDAVVCYASVLQDPGLEDRKLITNIYPWDGGITTIEENEVWAGNQLPQLTTDKIINQDEDYTVFASETASKFCVDASKLNVNSQYVISAMAKKYEDTGYRITELGDRRIAENKDKRVINNL